MDTCSEIAGFSFDSLRRPRLRNAMLIATDGLTPDADPLFLEALML
jgi:hypothetical protein